jgi:hypothetical protein
MEKIQFGNYKVYYTGKIINISKVSHNWSIFINNVKIPIEIKETRFTNKFRVWVDRRKIIETSDLGIYFYSQNLCFKVIKKDWNKFDIFVNGELFIGKKNNNGEEKNLYYKKSDSLSGVNSNVSLQVF